jgi:hypothetical protein
MIEQLQISFAHVIIIRTLLEIECEWHTECKISFSLACNYNPHLFQARSLSLHWDTRDNHMQQASLSPYMSI